MPDSRHFFHYDIVSWWLVKEVLRSFDFIARDETNTQHGYLHFEKGDIIVAVPKTKRLKSLHLGEIIHQSKEDESEFVKRLNEKRGISTDETLKSTETV